MSTRWFERPRIERWSATIVLAGLVLLSGPRVISAVASEPTTGEWLFFGIWVVATVAFAIDTAKSWRHRNDPPKPGLFESTFDPAVVDQYEVRAAIESSKDRIHAIKTLRERYPGLGLKDAVDLVDRHSKA